MEYKLLRPFVPDPNGWDDLMTPTEFFKSDVPVNPDDGGVTEIIVDGQVTNLYLDGSWMLFKHSAQSCFITVMALLELEKRNIVKLNWSSK